VKYVQACITIIIIITTTSFTIITSIATTTTTTSSSSNNKIKNEIDWVSTEILLCMILSVVYLES
jgi:hypothetical protein